jgi:filamentous hemagglutinin
MIGAGASGSLSANVGKGKNSSGWVHDQTIIIGEEEVDIRVEDNTHVEGAVIAAKNGNLKLDTNTLTYADIHDHDKASNINVGVSVSGSYNGGTDGPKQVEDEGAFDASLGSVSLDYSSKDRRQINRATIGEGTIIIRSDPDAGLEGLNRDLARAQEITKDSETAVSVYIDPAVIKEIASGFEEITEGFKSAGEEIQQLAREYQAVTAVLPEDMKYLGNAGLGVMQNMIRSGAEQDDIVSLMNDPEFQLVISGLANVGAGRAANISDDKQIQSRGTLTRRSDGQMVIEVDVNGPRAQTPGQEVAYALRAAKEYFDSIPYKEEAALALVGLQTLLTGPVKVALSTAGTSIVDAVLGDGIARVKREVAIEVAARLDYGMSAGAVILDFQDNKELSSTSREVEEFSRDVSGVEFGINVLIGSVGTIVGGKAVLGGGVGKGSVKLKYDRAAKTWTSPAGLVYGGDHNPQFGNRVKHVLAHCEPKPGNSKHTVFNVPKDQLLGLLDQAWSKKTNSFPHGGKTVHIVDMGRIVGTKGEVKIRIVTEPGTNEIISAYPVR